MDVRLNIAVACVAIASASYVLKSLLNGHRSGCRDVGLIFPGTDSEQQEQQDNADTTHRSAHAIQHDFADIITNKPVGAAVVMGLSMSQHAVTAAPKQEQGNIFGSESFII